MICRIEAFRLPAISDRELFEEADRLRRANFGNVIELCAIINIKSGNCSMDCKFCAQRRGSNAPGHGLLDAATLEQEILKLAAGPYRHIGLVASGGRLERSDLERLVAVVEKLPTAIRARLCASLGRLDAASLAMLKNCGIRRLHHNLETSSDFYRQVCTSQSWKARRDTVLRALETDLEVCCGGLFGMGESWQNRIDLALELAAMGVQNIPLNFLHPQADSPLGNRQPMPANEALRTIAIFRHILPKATLRVCGGRPICLGQRQDEMFGAGANALMSGNYLTTKGIGLARDLEMLENLGFVVDRAR